MFCEVQNALRVYLEQKRFIFPRFYFVADADVLEILASANSRPRDTLAPHIKKLFGAVESIEVDSQENGKFVITAIKSSEGETLNLKHGVIITPETPPELWLNRLDYAIKDSVRHDILGCLNI